MGKRILLLAVVASDRIAEIERLLQVARRARKLSKAHAKAEKLLRRGAKSKCCHAKKRCMRCPYVMHALVRLGSDADEWNKKSAMKKYLRQVRRRKIKFAGIKRELRRAA